jgi:sugar phosphate isomerase/epimerase
MKLSCADFAWPLLPHEGVLKLIKILDFEGVDLGMMGNRTHVRPEMVRSDIPMWSGILKERIAQAGLELADFFVIPWTDSETMAPNHPDAKQREESSALFHDMLDMAHRLEAPGMTILPGIRFGDESWEASIQRSAEALKWRVEAAANVGMRLSVEGHIGSNVDTPEKLARLIELTPGLTLTLDYTHFTYQGTPDSEIEPLLAHAGHFHCRGGTTGRTQTKYQDNTIDYRRVIQRMQEIGYDGYVAMEYVWINWQKCNETENTCETIQFRDLVRAAMAGHEYTAPQAPI